MNATTVLVLAGMVFTIMALIQGIASMAHGGVSDQARSHFLMFRRVGWQALTVATLLGILLIQMS
jgi:hypothetical protein